MFKKRNRNASSKQIRAKVAEEDDNDDTKVIKAQKVQDADDVKTNVSSSSSANKEIQVATIYESKGEILPQVYAGDATYTSVTENNKHIANNKSSSVQAPARAPAFLRATCRFDYQPDICKDYKETGFCGYGDQCKFLHDRGDYKSGWQLEKEWEEVQTNKKNALKNAMKQMNKLNKNNNESDGANSEWNVGEDEVVENEAVEDEVEKYSDDEMEELPFACLICREKFTIECEPIVTLCSHYFCKGCIIKHQAGRKVRLHTCPVCNQTTNGVYNRANKIIKRLSNSKALGVVSNNIIKSAPTSSWSVVEE